MLLKRCSYGNKKGNIRENDFFYFLLFISFISFNIVLQFLKISVDTIRKSEAIGKMSISKD